MPDPPAGIRSELMESALSTRTTARPMVMTTVVSRHISCVAFNERKWGISISNDPNSAADDGLVNRVGP